MHTFYSVILVILNVMMAQTFLFCVWGHMRLREASVRVPSANSQDVLEHTVNTLRPWVPVRIRQIIPVRIHFEQPSCDRDFCILEMMFA
jgi:hypothetical protein